MSEKTTTEPKDEQKNELVIPDRNVIEVVPFGTDERIKLSVKIVRDLIAERTKSGKEPTDRDCIRFMMLCRARHLNPFEGDAYLLGYDSQDGPTFTLITAHQVFLKRAEASKGFRGLQSGVVIRTKEGDIKEREGDLTFTGEMLVGGWAKVHRKELEFPIYKVLKLETFSTNRSRWAKDPAGMIVKCAEADALRTAFPTHLGGLYVQEEIPPIEVEGREIQIERPVIGDSNTKVEGSTKGKKRASKDKEPEPETPDKGQAEPPPEREQPKKKLNLTPSTETEPVKVGPNEADTVTRLAFLGKTRDDYIRVVKRFDGLEPDQTWEDMNEGKFRVFLHPDNWAMIEEALK